MYQQPETVTLWNMVTWHGICGIVIFYLTLTLFIATPILFIIFKSRRPFLVWLTSQNIKFNILAGLCLLLWGIFNALNFEACSAEICFLIGTHKAVSGLWPIAFITTASFTMKFVLELILKLKKTEPENGESTK